MGTIRSFIALELPEDLQKALAEAQQKLQKHTDCVRWVRPENIHLTLKFLGSLAEEQIKSVAAVLEKTSSGVTPFSFQAAGIGAFPNRRNPSIIWVGIKEAQGQIMRFQQQLDEALAAIGFPKEKRSFTPHLTLGRIKFARGKKDLAHLLEQLDSEDLGCFQTTRVILFRSDLHPTGPVYSAMKTVQL